MQLLMEVILCLGHLFPTLAKRRLCLIEVGIKYRRESLTLVSLITAHDAAAVVFVWKNRGFGVCKPAKQTGESLNFISSAARMILRTTYESTVIFADGCSL